MIPNYHAIPASTIETIQAHVRRGTPTGHFVKAVLSNDLKEACGRADKLNAAALWKIVCYCHNEIPADSWGSPEKVRAWREDGGLDGLASGRSNSSRSSSSFTRTRSKEQNMTKPVTDTDRLTLEILKTSMHVRLAAIRGQIALYVEMGRITPKQAEEILARLK